MIKRKIIVALTLLLLTAALSNGAEWWDPTFRYHTPVHINNTGTASTLTDYQVLINVSYDTEMQSDFDDIRFVNVSTTTSLPFYILNKVDSSYCNCWVRLPKIKASVWSNDTLAIYYGNDVATAGSNGDNTFEMFDDFEGSCSGSVSGWTEQTGANFDYTATSAEGSCGGTMDTDSGYSFNQAYRQPGTNLDDRVYDFYMRSSAVSGEKSIVIQRTLGAYDNGIRLTFRPTTSQISYFDSTGFHSLQAFSINTWYHIKITTDTSANTFDIDIDNVNKGNDLGIFGSYSTGVNSFGLRGISGSNILLDILFVRKTATIEPITLAPFTDISVHYLQWKTGETVTNIIGENGEIWASTGKNDSVWTMKGFAANATVGVSSYSDGEGGFQITNGIIDQVTVTNFSSGDLVKLSKGSVTLEIGTCDSNGEYTFTSNLDIASYTLEKHSYPGNSTGIHGYVFEGYVGMNNTLPYVNVYIYNTTWSDTSVTDAGGYYSFTNLTNTTYTLNFKKDRYEEVLYQYVTPINNSMYYKSIYMQKSTGDYYSRHYATFTLKNMYGARYNNVNAVVYDNGNVETSGITGFDGSVTFHLFEDVEYRITFINITQNINEEIKVFPKDNEYNIYVSGFSFTPDGSTNMNDNVNWWYLKNDHNLTYAWLNFSYRNPDNKTSFIEYWINDTNNTNLFYTNQTYPCSSGVYISNNLVNSSNHTYIVHFSAIHPDYPSLAESGMQTISYYTGKMIDLLFSEQWQYTVLSLCIIIFIAMFFGATNAAKGSLIIVLTAWFFSFIQWLPSSIPGYAALVLASVLAVAWNMRKSEVVHT